MKKKKKNSFKYVLRTIANNLMTYALFVAILGCTCAASIITIVINKSDIILDPTDLKSSDSSIIYDEKGQQVALLGSENRINISYESLPQCVIDAFVAVEDSRYFEHPGFDLPRFAKAVLVNLSTMNFDQGGSTFTMQVIKNTYFELTAAKGKSIDRKIKEIYYSLQINNLISKEKLFEMYINKINFGSSTRGIQVAASYYFGKEASELNLVESAMLAGIINLPNIYNPYVNPTKCQQRTATVLYQMLNHGYITQDEYNLAIKVNVIDLLSGTNGTISKGKTIRNQSYIDVVIDELINTYGIDPYTTAVKVYTGLNQNVQSFYDDIADGIGVNWRDEYLNCASICMNNSTGLVIGILGGRNYSTARRLNYATDARYNSGSVAKAMFVYPLGFEYLPWMATNTTILDAPMYYAGTNLQIMNIEREYLGEISIEDAFTRSLNIPAIHIYEALEEKVGKKTIQNYLSKINIDKSVIDIVDCQAAFGSGTFTVSVEQMVGAQAVIMNSGYYTTPHTITRIEFINSTKQPIVANYESTQILSEGAAWLTAQLEAINVDITRALTPNIINFARTSKLKIDGVEIFGKTGTTSIPQYYVQKYNMTDTEGGGISLLASTNEYSTATWVGYDYSVYCDEKCLLTGADRGKYLYDTIIAKGAINITLQDYGKPERTKYEMPESVSKITTVTGLYPYESLPNYSSSAYVSTGYTLKKNVSISAWKKPTIDSISEVSAHYSVKNTRYQSLGLFDEESIILDENGNEQSILTQVEKFGDVEVAPYQEITITLPEYSDINKTKVVGTTYEMAFGKTYDEEGNIVYDENGNEVLKDIYTLRKRFDRSWVDGVVVYNIVIYDQDNNIVTTMTSNTNVIKYEPETPITIDTTYRIVASYKYTIAPVQSNTVETTVEINGTAFQ